MAPHRLTWPRKACRPIARMALVLAVAGSAGQAMGQDVDSFILRGSGMTESGAEGIPWLEQTVEPAIGGSDPASAPDTVERISGRRNLRTSPLDRRNTRPRRETAGDRTGIRIGRFIMRPAISEKIVGERSSSGNSTQSRLFSRTEGNVELLSDWSRHELRLEGTGVFEKNLSGDASTDPAVDFDAALRLDLASETTATLRAGYSFAREDETDPNALQGATTQAGVHTLKAGAGLERSAGLFRGRFDIDGVRETYGEAELGDGTELNLDDRDQTSVAARARLVHDRAAAFAPFLETEIERSQFDQTRDRGGYARSAWTYSLRSGIEIDMGEKWSGELAVGYSLRDTDDERLDDIDTPTLDGFVNWSPRRGTDVAFGLYTDIESSTAPGLPGSAAYAGYLSLTQAVRHDLVARLGGGVTLRRYKGPGIEDQHVYNGSASLTWSLNPRMDLVAEAEYERAVQDGSAGYDTATFGLGVILRR